MKKYYQRILDWLQKIQSVFLKRKKVSYTKVEELIETNTEESEEIVAKLEEFDAKGRQESEEMEIKLAESISEESTKLGESILEEPMTSSVLESLNIGDIILAKRYQTESEMNNIQTGHRVGPYLIIQKSENKVLCIKGSGVNPLDKYPQLELFKYMMFQKGQYSLQKTTYFHMLDVKWVKQDQFISKLDSLSVHDFYEVGRKLEQVMIHCVASSLHFTRKDIPKIPYYPGDVVLLGNLLYYIYEIKEQEVTVFQLKRTEDTKGISMNNHTYSYDLKNCVTIPYRNIRNLYGIVDWKQVKLIHNEKERLDHREEAICMIERGSVISFQDKKYYVYGIESYQYQAFEIFGSSSDFIKIFIEKEPFYANFVSEVLISMKENSIIGLYKASEEERDIISSQRKAYKKKLKQQEAKNVKPVPIFPEIQEKAVVQIKGNDIWCCQYEKPYSLPLIQISVNKECVLCEQIVEEQYLTLLGYHSGMNVKDREQLEKSKEWIRKR